MNSDQVKGKVKDVAGRAERQVGEWTGDSEKQADGSLKQAEGKVQNAWGNVKEAAKDAVNKGKRTDRATTDDTAEVDEEVRDGRKAS
jgi:uncharacterized protein YjbJ (UPF0337 family)